MRHILRQGGCRAIRWDCFVATAVVRLGRRIRHAKPSGRPDESGRCRRLRTLLGIRDSIAGHVSWQGGMPSRGAAAGRHAWGNIVGRVMWVRSSHRMPTRRCRDVTACHPPALARCHLGRARRSGWVGQTRHLGNVIAAGYHCVDSSYVNASKRSHCQYRRSNRRETVADGAGRYFLLARNPEEGDSHHTPLETGAKKISQKKLRFCAFPATGKPPLIPPKSRRSGSRRHDA